MTDIWVLLVGQATWQTVLVAGVVLALVRVGRRLPAGIRHGLLAVALLKFLTPPFLAAPTGVLAALAAPVTIIDHSAVGPSEPAEWLSILAALHLTGTAAMIGFVLAAWVRSRLWVRRGSPAPAHAAQVCETVGKRLGMPRHVELLLSAD